MNEKHPRQDLIDESSPLPPPVRFLCPGRHRHLARTAALLFRVRSGRALSVTGNAAGLRLNGHTLAIVELTSKGKMAFYAHEHWHEQMDGGFRQYMNSLVQEQMDLIYEVLSNVENFLKTRL